MKVRFQADADLNFAIVNAALRKEPRIDFLSAYAGGVLERPDPEVLELAAKSGRVLVTHDRRTMPHHFGERLQSASSAGLIVVPQSMPIGAASEELVLIWSVTDAEEWINRVAVLPL